MTLSMSAMLGLQTRFHVTIDGVDLGGWGQCKGLSVDFHPEPILEGGNYDYKPILAGQMEYPAITLERAMEAQSSMAVQNWLRSRVSNWVHAMSSGHSAVEKGINAVSSAIGAGNIAGGVGGTGQITLFDAQGKSVISWSLRNVYPSKWHGPALDAATYGIAKESLELVHEGFL